MGNEHRNKIKEIEKEPLIDRLHGEKGSSLRKYNEFFVGDPGLLSLVKYELVTSLFGSIPGGLGILFRKKLYPYLMRKSGAGNLFGKDVDLRHPGKIEMGQGVSIDTGCLIDAKGAGDKGVVIGNDVVIARNTIVQGKTSWVEIGDNCIIGDNCTLTSAGGIRIGNYVGIAGHCYIGGAYYHYDDRETPIMDQGAYTKGPIDIGDDVWLGAGAVVSDGVRIGKGCVIGAGSVLMEDVTEYTVVIPRQSYFKIPRT